MSTNLDSLKTKVSVMTKIDEKILDDNAREDQLRGRVDELSSSDQHISRYTGHNTMKVCHKCCSPDHFERDCQWTYPCHDCKETHKAGSALCRYSSNNLSKSAPSYRMRKFMFLYICLTIKRYVSTSIIAF